MQHQRRFSVTRKSKYTSCVPEDGYISLSRQFTVLSKAETRGSRPSKSDPLPPAGKIRWSSTAEFTKGRVTRCFLLFARLIAPYRLGRVFLQTIYKRYTRYHWYTYACIGLYGIHLGNWWPIFNNSLLYLLLENKIRISRDILFGYFILWIMKIEMYDKYL